MMIVPVPSPSTGGFYLFRVANFFVLHSYRTWQLDWRRHLALQISGFVVAYDTFAIEPVINFSSVGQEAGSAAYPH